MRKLRPLMLDPHWIRIGILVDRFLERKANPRRHYIGQPILYGGTFVIIAVSVWLRHR
jgi:hypothetical protein